MQLGKLEGLQVRARPNQSQTKQTRTKLWHSAVKNTVEVCVSSSLR